MKKLLGLAIFAIFATLATSCSLSDLPQLEPTHWEKEQFEKHVENTVRDALRTPGIDNGATLVITQEGDTLLAPVDTTLVKSDIRTIYLKVEPQYPKGISSKWTDMIVGCSIAGFICLVVLLLLFGIFILVMRRQHANTKIIRSAIENNYELPEAYFTRSPRAPKVTVNQLFENPQKTADGPAPSAGNSTPGDNADMEARAAAAAATDSQAIREAVKGATSSGAVSVKEMRQGFIMIGIGVILFLAFAASDNVALAFIAGGTLLVLGLAKFLPLFIKKL